MSEEFWFKHRQRKAWFESRTPKEIEEIEQWMIERHKLKRQLAEAREALLDFEKHVIKHNYHVSNPILNKHETLLKQLKEKGE